MADARLGHQPQEPVDQPEPGAQDRDDEHLVGEPHAGRALERRLDRRSRRRAARASPRSRGSAPRPSSSRGTRDAACRLSRRIDSSRRSSTWSTTVTPSMPRNVLVSAPMAAPRRNIELKASDPDPERSLAVVLGLGARDRGRPAPARHLLPRHHGPPEAARGGARAAPTLVQYDRVDADEARESRYRLDPGRRPGDAVRRARGQPRHARGGREGAPPAAVAERPHPPRPRQGPRQLRRARGRRDRGLRPRRRARPRHAAHRGAGDRARAHPAQLLLGPGRRLERARRRRPRRDGARPRAVQPLPRRRRAARRGRLDPRRRQRRERRVPAGPVRGGVRDRRAGRVRAASTSPRSR